MPNTKPRAAAASMVTGMLVIGCIDNFVAPLSQEVGLWQFYLLRGVLAIPVIVAASLWGLGSLRPLRWWAVGLRALLMACAMVFYFGALAYIPLPQALAGLFTSPIFVLLISALALGQRVGPWRVAAVAMGFLGIILVVEPWGSAWSLAALMPVLGGMLYACGCIAGRALCAREAVLAMLLALFLCQGLIGAGALLVVGPGGDDFLTRAWVWPLSPEAWRHLAVISFGSILGVGFLIRAYALGDASYVAVFEYSVFLFGAFFAWVFFDQLLSLSAAVGIALIALSGIVIVLRAPPE